MFCLPIHALAYCIVNSTFSILHSASLRAVLKISRSLYGKRVRVFVNKTLTAVSNPLIFYLFPLKEGPEEKPVISRTIQIHNLHLFSYARAAAETAYLGLASKARQDDVPQQTLMAITALFHSRNRLTDANIHGPIIY